VTKGSIFLVLLYTLAIKEEKQEEHCALFIQTSED